MKLRRPRRLLERQLPWALLFLLASAAAWLLAAAIDLGLVAAWHASLRPSLRGHTGFGIAAGVASCIALAVALAYAFRKRGFQEHTPVLKGTLAIWLWAHVYSGLFALVAALVHGGYGVVSLQFSSGKLLLLLLVGLLFSGLLWRLLYWRVPRKAARDVGNYALDASGERAVRQLVEVDKLAAGRSQQFQELKAWFLRERPPMDAVDRAAAALPAQERSAFVELTQAVTVREQALARQQRQLRYLGRLGRWRWVHVPVSLAFLIALPVHVLFATEVPLLSKTLRPWTVPIGAFATADACKSCHRKIVEQWQTSMHAHAMTSPLMIAQTNQVVRKVLAEQESPDPQKICINCHGPIGAAFSSGPGLPVESESMFLSAELLNEGVSCSVCHQLDGDEHALAGRAGLSGFQSELQPGRRYFGPHADAVDNAFHRSARGGRFAEPETLCKGCHSVVLDTNGDGHVRKGEDLVLQTLYEEWEVYRKAGGESCLDCHMPVVAETRAAESALLVLEQDRDAPPRRVRDHSFVGVDYPLEWSADEDKTRPARQALLARAARLSLADVRREGQRVELSARVANVGTGHNLPGGFGFVRQMWLEVRVQDAAGRVLASSGKIESPAADLCDGSVVGAPNNPLRSFVQGCGAADPLLVNFQQQLVNEVETVRGPDGRPLLDAYGQPKLRAAPGAQEVVLQHLGGGPVPRVRPFGKRPVPPLAPGEEARFVYAFSLPEGVPSRVVARLLFRTVPPYLLRALADEQTPDEPPLLPLIQNLRVEQMAIATAPVAQ